VGDFCFEAGPTARLRGKFVSDVNKILRIAVPTADDMDLSADLLAVGQVKLARVGTSPNSFSHPAHATLLDGLLRSSSTVYARVQTLGSKFALGGHGISDSGAEGSEVGVHRVEW
jgi:hypothetical protein